MAGPGLAFSHAGIFVTDPERMVGFFQSHADRRQALAWRRGGKDT